MTNEAKIMVWCLGALFMVVAGILWTYYFANYGNCNAFLANCGPGSLPVAALTVPLAILGSTFIISLFLFPKKEKEYAEIITQDKLIEIMAKRAVVNGVVAIDYLVNVARTVPEGTICYRSGYGEYGHPGIVQAHYFTRGHRAVCADCLMRFILPYPRIAEINRGQAH